MASSHVTPVGSDLQFGRVDQGVDYTSAKSYVSPGAGVVYHIGHGFAGGTGTAVYIRLDKPIVVNGRAYREVYFAETSPLVKQGQRVKAGQPVTAAGSAELGFASGNGPAAQLVGGLGAGTHPTMQGNDFLSFVKGSPTYAPPNPMPTVAPPAVAPAAVALPSVDYSTSATVGPPQPEQTQAQILPPGTPSPSYALWQRVVQASTSPDPQTLAYMQLSQGG